MKTEDLVTLLASGAGPVRRHVFARRYGAAAALGFAAALALMLAWLGLNPVLADYLRLPMFWAKAALPLLLAAGALLAVARLSRPGALVRRLPLILAAPPLTMGLLAVVELLAADPGQRTALVLGETWAVCPFNIALLSLPAFAAALWAMKGLAPTRLRWAGAAAGLLAGTLGAAAYSLHCPELAAPFLALWYVLGMLIPAGIGALVGPRVLGW